MYMTDIKIAQNRWKWSQWLRNRLPATLKFEVTKGSTCDSSYIIRDSTGKVIGQFFGGNCSGRYARAAVAAINELGNESD